MASLSPRIALTELALSVQPSPESIRVLVERIHGDVLLHSPYIREPNFKAIHPQDLEFLFNAYDKLFFEGLCRQSLEGRRLTFRLSRRMTRAGGTTTRFISRSGVVSFEIAIASSMLFDGFRDTDRRPTACGIECANRLEAMQRIFEHEMVHLTEHLCWNQSDCSAARFQGIARRLFLHEAHTHNLITRRERAAESGIRVGARVVFEFEGRQLSGRVNRITKRATVLVEDPAGRRFTDGRHYKIFYVPIGQLVLVEVQAQ